jgi:hypothetical protein
MGHRFNFHPSKYLFERHRHRLDEGARTSPAGSKLSPSKTINRDIGIVSEECKLDSEVRETGKVEVTKLLSANHMDHHM